MRKFVISASLAIAAGCLQANAAVVFTSVATYGNPNGGLISSGGPGLPAYVPVGQGYLTVITFVDSTGPTPQGISWQLERADNAVGALPAQTDFQVWQQMPGYGASAGPVSMTFDGVKTYTFTVLSPVPTYVYDNGSATYSYFLAPRYPNNGDFFNDPNGTSIVLGWQPFQLIAIPEAGSVLLGGMGLLALLRRRR